MLYRLTDQFVVRAELDTVWRFFADARNLSRITPPWLGFAVLDNGPVELKHGTVLDYTIRWARLPLRWRTLITEWHPPTPEAASATFTDLQARGPYSMWLHRHAFERAADGTVCSDTVLYKLPGGWIGRAMNALVVKRQLTDIFTFRREKISQELGWVRELSPIRVEPT